MRVTLCMLLLAVSVLADSNEERRSKPRPFVADAVGNTLPPPSNVPATVGSPVNLLTPDRYEFYTFDESGELVKRLMTMEEIQAIVAAGEDSEGLVTFANDNQPTIAFNFSQPSHTKVHSVVTNVQNVLKAQMEAHKYKPLIQPTLDTPDVSDSWSLILPSIFGNTGVDIVPDKSSGSFTTPETETFDLYHPIDTDDNSLSKEGSQLLNNSINSNYQKKESTTEKISDQTEEIKEKPHTTSRITSTTTTTTGKPTTTTQITTTTKLPSTTKKAQSLITTTSKIPLTIQVTSTTLKPHVSTTSTIKPVTAKTTVSITTKKTTVKPASTTERHTITATANLNGIQPHNYNAVPTTDKIVAEFEKFSTFVPVSTIKYVTERTTHKPTDVTKLSIDSIGTRDKAVTTTTKPSSALPAKTTTITTSNPLTSMFGYISSNDKDQKLEKINTTTMTTQSVSPSTTISSTEIITAEHSNLFNNITEHQNFTDSNDSTEIKDNEPLIPLFDVAQSISQIATDLGGNFQPVPTASNLQDTTKINEMELESKEDLEMDIPTTVGPVIETTMTNSDKGDNNFVKISTLDPHPLKDKITDKEPNKNNNVSTTTEEPENTELTTISSGGTTEDLFLNESMDDLLSQVVNEIPQSIVDSDKFNENSNIYTTEQVIDTTTEVNLSNIETTSEVSITNIKESTETTTTENAFDETVITYNETSTDKPLQQSDVKYNDSLNENTPKTSDMSKNEYIKNYVQIPVSNNNSNNISKTESVPNIINTRNESILNTIDIMKDNNQVAQKPDMLQESKGNDKIKNKIQGTEKSSIIVELTTETLPLTTAKIINEHTLTETNGTKLDWKEKMYNSKKDANSHIKSKTPEPLPKIDDFKKKIQKVNIADEELASERNNSWKLIPTMSPQKGNELSKDKLKSENHYTPDVYANKEIVLEFSTENQGLEATTKNLGEDIAQFTKLCNELAFRYWNVMTEHIDKKRSFVLSPYSITSMLAMMFMGAKGATSGEMNEILKLDDMVTFNPHFILKNISDSIEPIPESGIMVSAFIRELYSDRNKGNILTFYKERAQHFYNGHVEEINFKLISDIIRRRTNLLVKRYTWGKIAEYMKTNSIVMHPPLAAFSANIFQTDCTGSSVEGRDGEMYFVVSPNVRQRRLVPVPAVVYKKGFLAGYDPVLDATAAAIGNTNSIISTLFLMPGQQGNVVHADDLEKLEHRLVDAIPMTPTWNRLLRTLLPRIGLELQIPRLSHKSIFNVSTTLRKMGLKDLFDAEHADLGGLNGPSKDLYLSDMIQMTTFVTCGEEVIGDQHHIEEYPESLGPVRRSRTSRWDWDEPGDYQRAFHDPHDVGEAMHLPLHLRPRQARLPTRNAQPARLKFDRPFLYFVRHNPTGMILYVGRYNPRLLP